MPNSINSIACHEGAIFITGNYTESILRFSNGGGLHGPQPGGSPNYFIAKYLSDGDLLWVRVPPYTNLGNSGASQLTVDGTGLHTLINFQNSVQHPLGPITSEGGFDILLERSDLDGVPTATTQIGGTASENGNDIIQHAGYIYVLGTTANGSSLLAPSTCSLAVGANMFIIRFRDEAVGISEPDRSRSIRISPNPTDGQCTVQVPSYAERITISDATGRSILQQNIRWAEAGVRVDLSDVQPGVYMVLLEGKGPRLATKVHVQ